MVSIENFSLEISKPRFKTVLSLYVLQNFLPTDVVGKTCSHYPKIKHT